jgi:glutamyl-tRNA reductase
LSRGIAKRFREAGVFDLFIANRTYSRALEMSAEFNARALRLEEVSAVLNGVDVLVTATSSPVPLFNRIAFPQQAKMLVVDLGVPRNVEEEVGSLPGVKLLNIEEVEKMLDRDAVERREDIRVSQAILEEELSLFVVRKSGKTATFSRAS